jgi:predicted hydrocarbon binding protein
MDKSNLFLPNNFVLLTINAFDEIVGKMGMVTVIKQAKLDFLLEAYPPDDGAKEFDFADYSALLSALEDIYGARGARVLSIRAGRLGFRHFIDSSIGDINDFIDPELPEENRLQILLESLAEMYNEISDFKCSVQMTSEGISFINSTCPVCWGRKQDTPGCNVTLGILMEAVMMISENYKIEQVSSISCGSPSCDFMITKAA